MAIPVSSKVDVATILEDMPLHEEKRVSSLFERSEDFEINLPEGISVHCDDVQCGGVRRHTKISAESYFSRRLEAQYHYCAYACTNCLKSSKIFGLRTHAKQGTVGTCSKIYQEPTFGAPIPPKLFKVIGEDNRELFLKARRASARGLGIGSYAYYRRIIENTKFNLIAEILRVAEATEASPTQIALLRAAQKETQFSKAISILADVSSIPSALLINGHNPLTLLHDSLSEGIHKLDDAECLARAQEAEVILCEIAERVQAAVSERKVLKEALGSIFKRRANSQTPEAEKS